MQSCQSDRHFNRGVVVVVDPDHRVVSGSSSEIKNLEAHFTMDVIAKSRTASPNENIVCSGSCKGVDSTQVNPVASLNKICDDVGCCCGQRGLVYRSKDEAIVTRPARKKIFAAPPLMVSLP